MALYGLPGGITPDALNQLMGQSRGSWSSANPGMQQDISEWTQLASLLGYVPDAFPKMGSAGQDEARFMNTMKSIMDQQLGAFGEGTQINQLPGSMQQMFQMFAPLLTSPGATRSVAPVGTAGMMSGGYKSGPLPSAMSPLIQLALSAMQQSGGASQTSAAAPANANPAMAALPVGNDPALAAAGGNVGGAAGNAITAGPAQDVQNMTSVGVQSDADLARYGPEGQQFQQDPGNAAIMSQQAGYVKPGGEQPYSNPMDPRYNPQGAIPGVNAGPSGEPTGGATGANVGAVLSNLMQNPQMGQTVMAALMNNPQTRPIAMALQSMGQTGGQSMGSIVPGVGLIQQLQQMAAGGR